MESDRDWAAFVAYRDNFPRSLPRDPDSLKVARNNHWVSRSRAWDKHWEEVRAEERKEAIREAEQRMADELAGLAYLGVMVAKHEIQAAAKRQASSPDGSAETITITQATALLKECRSMWAQLHGEPTERVAHEISSTDLSLEDLERHLKILGELPP